MGYTYFATDGSYGDAANIVMVDTSDWTDDDWDMVTYARDTDRAEIATSIASRSGLDQLSLFNG
jgi:hypothetical protein